jgi:hypothetical protein
MASLFAYGTLRDIDILESVLGRAVDASRLRSAAAPDCAVVFFPGLAYPALRHAPGAIAPGTLIDALSDADWLCLDAFEGDEYRRAPVEIVMAGCTMPVDAYWPTIAVDAAPAWQFEAWQARCKAGLLFAEPAIGVDGRPALAR